jgi:hypothetical protein
VNPFGLLAQLIRQTAHSSLKLANLMPRKRVLERVLDVRKVGCHANDVEPKLAGPAHLCRQL